MVFCRSLSIYFPNGPKTRARIRTKAEVWAGIETLVKTEIWVGIKIKVKKTAKIPLLLVQSLSALR